MTTLLRPTTLVVAAMLLASRPHAGLAQGGGGVPRITRADAVREALAHNPLVQVSLEQVAQSRARVNQALAIPEPQFGVNLIANQSALQLGRSTETDLSLGVTVPMPNKIRLAGQVARGDLSATTEASTLQGQQIALQANQAYDSLLGAAQHRKDLEEAQRLAQDFVAKTQARYNAGTAPRLDVIQAQVGLAQAENDLIASERGVARARAALNRVLGRVLTAPIDAADSLTIPPEPGDLERLVPLALQRRPELRGLEGQQAGARAAQRLAQQYFIPDIVFGVSRNNAYGAGVSYSTNVGIGIPLFPWQHQRGAVAEATHREAELAAQHRDVSSQVEQDLRDTFATASTALRQATFIRDELLPSAREAYRIASTAYTLGTSSTLEVIQAQRTLLDAQTQYVAALATANDAIADLERATGGPLSPASPGRAP